MNKDEIKWISYYGKETSTLNLSFREKMNKFGFCLDFDEFGSDKSSKAQLSILDVIQNKEKANILIVCPKHIMHSWYRDIIVRSGVDFKMLSDSAKAISYYSDTISNFYIVSENALKQGCATLEEFDSKSINWDLVIIDASLDIEGLNCSLYTEGIKSKAEKLALFSSVPCAYQESFDNLKNMIKSLLADEEKAAIVDTIDFSKDTVRFNPDTPVSRYYDTSVYNGDVARNVVLIKYKFDEAFMSNLKKLVDIKTGLPLYCYGANIFEEYGIEQKKIYTKPVYTGLDVNELRAVDKKLDSFLTELDEALKSDDSKIIVYCVTTSTISYLKKVLAATYPGASSLVKIDRGDIFNTRYGEDNFSASSSSDKARIVIAVDSIGSIDENMKKYTHIFNYELPNSPVVLEQRAARHGGVDEKARKFFVFCDENGLFESRMLSKVLFGKIYKALVSGLPGRSVMFDLPNATDLIAMAIKDLQYICGYTGEVSNCYDLLVQFRGDYNIGSEIDASTAAKTHEYTALKLDKIYKAFGISDRIKDYNTDEKALKQMIKPVIDSYANSLLYLDENQHIVPIKGDELKDNLNADMKKDYDNYMKGSDICSGLKTAKAALADFVEANRNAELRLCVDELSDDMRLPVLLGCWNYLTTENKINYSFRAFMKNYNEGVM